MSTELILKKLDEQANRLSNIEVAMAKMVRQDEKILTLQKQVKTLFKNNDLAFNPKDGVVTKMKEFQKECPRESIKSTLNGQWLAIALLATICTAAGIWA